MNQTRPKFQVSVTSCWRGYIATWEIKNDALYLVGIDARLEDGSKVLVENLFPNSQKQVKAVWYSGELVIPRGKMLEYVHLGYASRYEQYLVISIKNGNVVDTKVREDDLEFL